MAIRIFKMGHQAYKVIDDSVPGWEELGQAATEEDAQRLLGRILAEHSNRVRLAWSQGIDTTAADTARREALASMLDGKAQDVRAAVGRCESADDLRTLAELERQGSYRKTVLGAIEARLEAVA